MATSQTTLHREIQPFGWHAGVWWIAFFVALFPALGALGQERTIHFEHFPRSRGLSQSSVQTIVQDPEGFLWIGTQAGLNRFDGYRFEVFENTLGDPVSLPHDWVFTLHVDPAGRLWVGTEGGLALWRPSNQTFETFRNDPEDLGSLPSDRIRVLADAGEGRLWLGTSETGIARFDPVEGKVESFRHREGDPTSLIDDNVRALHPTRDGGLLVGTLSGVDVFDPATGQFSRWDPARTSPFPDTRIRSILEDRKGHLWIGTFGSLAHYDPETGKLDHTVHDAENRTSLSGGRVRSLWEDRNGNLWIGTDEGLSLLRRSGEEEGLMAFDRYRHQVTNPSSLSHDRVTAIFEDRSGNLWVGTQGGGLDRWGPVAWSFGHYWSDPAEPEGGMTSNSVLAITELDGEVWVGSFGGGLGRLDREAGARRHYSPQAEDPTSLPADEVTSLLATQEGRLWVGTFSAGLSRFQPATESFERFQYAPDDPTSLSSDAVMSLFESRRGEMWIGTYGGGLNQFLGDEDGFRHWRHDTDDKASLSNDRVTSFAEDRQGNLWVGTDGGGLNRLDAERSRFERFFRDPKKTGGRGIPLGSINALHLDPEGALWVGGKGGGLWRLQELEAPTDALEVEVFTERDGLANSTIYGIEEDSQGALWISTNDGLSRLDPDRRTFKNYDTSHGLQSNEFNLGAHYRSSRGELFFGGINGFNAFFPEAIEENRHVPPIVLISFSKLNTPVQFDQPLSEIDTIELDHRDDVVSFEVAALDFSAPHKNRYRYTLEGFNDDWIDNGHRRRIDFTNLDPGEYTLWVQGSNNDGVWNEEGLRLDVVITPPFWQTWWFRGGSVVALASMLLLVFRLRTRTIRLNNERLTALVQERTRDLETVQEKLLRQERLAVLGELAGSVAHEIRNPLGVIRNASYYLKLTQKDKIDTTGQEHLELIDREIEQTNRIIGELLDYARDRPADARPAVLQDLVTRGIELVEIPDNVSLSRSRWNTDLQVRVDHDQVKRLLANLVQNAVQAMPEGGDLKIVCQRHDDRVMVRVCDSGTGIAEGDLDKIFEPLFTTKANGIGLGLALSQRYARLNGGHLEFDSRLGEGTEFRLVLPSALPDPNGTATSRSRATNGRNSSQEA